MAPLRVATVFIVAAALSNCTPEQDTRTTAQKKADEHKSLIAEWIANRDKLKGEIEAAIKESRFTDARRLIVQYSPTGDPEIPELERRRTVAQLTSEVAKMGPDKAIARAAAYRQLVDADPSNPKWKRELAAAERAEVTYRRKLDSDKKRALQAELAQRKTSGVVIGMTQHEAILSSWGRPERVNKTVTPSGVTEQWVYGHGNYLYFRDGILTSIQTSR